MKPGATCVAAIKDWMRLNNRRPVWEELEVIIDKAIPPPASPQKILRRPTAEWLDELRRDPANEGLDVDRELAKCQLWCNEHRKQCTRARFLNWLLRAERVIAPGRVAINALPELPGWRLFLEERHAEFGIEQMIPATWDELPRSTREIITGSKHRLKGLLEFADNREDWETHLEQLRNRRMAI